jgi:hypothetical protein
MKRTYLAFAMLAAAIAPALAQGSISRAAQWELLDSYTAYIGVDDLYNSSGSRLNQPWQIIRQDRANFHRFGIRDDWDQSDSFFSREANRAAMEQMLANGDISSSAARAIVRGDAVIQVDIYGRGDRGDWVEVTVLN